MHVRTDAIPIVIDAPGAVARQQRDFGDAGGPIGAEHMVLKGGTDLAPLLLGLADDACASPHWGYVVAGDVVVSYLDGTVERCTAGDVVHWPAGHRLRVIRDAELVLFSPQEAHTPVLDHIRERAPAARPGRRDGSPVQRHETGRRASLAGRSSATVTGS